MIRAQKTYAICDFTNLIPKKIRKMQRGLTLALGLNRDTGIHAKE